MGIKSINKFLKDIGINDAFYNSKLDSFSGKRIAIDACGYFYQILCSANKDVILKMTNPLEDIDKELIIKKASERLSIFLCQLISYSIIPVFIWDGKKIKCKETCLKERLKNRNNI